MTVSLKHKQEFIRWFLSNYQMKRRESNWILNYLLSHDEVLARVHFVENIENCPRGLMMSTYNMEQMPFVYIKDGETSIDPEKAFHDIRLSGRVDFYVHVSFRDALSFDYYLDVLEENPYLDSSEFSEEAGMFLDHCLHMGERDRLLRRIDVALDEKNEALFATLSEALQLMDKEKEGNVPIPSPKQKENISF